MSGKTVLLDGAVGTSLWEKSDDKLPVWRYNIEKPAIVSELHEEYIAAGAEIILANTFGANGGAVSRSPYAVRDVVGRGVALAREAAAGRVRVALSAGPLMGLLEPYGDVTEEEAHALYAEMLGAGMEERPDLIFLQTFIDLSMLRIAAEEARKFDVPLFCAMSFEAVGKTMMGNSVADMAQALRDLRPDALGLNCSLGPDAALPVMRMFREATDAPLLFKPNAGKPSADGGAEFDIDAFVAGVLPARDLGVTYLGGCCGANAAYIAALRDALNK